MKTGTLIGSLAIAALCIVYGHPVIGAIVGVLAAINLTAELIRRRARRR